MEWLKSILEILLGSELLWGTAMVLALGKILPNKWIDTAGETFGIFCTLGMSRIIPAWNKIEEWFIDGVAVFVTAWIRGLRSDNTKSETPTTEKVNVIKKSFMQKVKDLFKKKK